MTKSLQQSDDAYLVIQSVSKKFGSICANRTISLTVHAGEICGLLGPNGAGKTTLIRQCAGWLEPDEGTITILGVRQTANERRTRRRLGIISHDAPLYRELTVREALVLQGTLYELSGQALRDAVSDAITRYHIEQFANRRIEKLSTGMRQRVMIASAMLHKPAVLLLDEPTVGLDPEIRQYIWSCLHAAADAGAALILTTHYLEEAANLCQKVHLLVDGAIAVSLSPGKDGHTAHQLEQAYQQAVAFETPRVETHL
jgi:ABC-type multidrug transport system ATPase subunit